jgi:protein phosphatase
VLLAHGISDKGSVRAVNEDCFGIDQRIGLCVIADGMGGHKAGEVAARIAVDTVTDYVRESLARGIASYGPFGSNPSLSADANLLQTAIHLANMQILETAISEDACSGMGTTVVAALVRGKRLSVAHVGDSRLYLYNGKGLRQLTDDDSWTASLLARDPARDAASLKDHPLRHALTNVVGAHPRTEVHLAEEVLAGGERLVMTTDGVHGPLDEEHIEAVIREGKDAAEMAHRLVTAALGQGSRDNCTAVVAEFRTE